MVETIRRFREQTGGFGCFLAQHHDLANREATNYSTSVHAPGRAAFPGLQRPGAGNIEWIEIRAAGLSTPLAGLGSGPAALRERARRGNGRRNGAGTEQARS